MVKIAHVGLHEQPRTRPHLACRRQRSATKNVRTMELRHASEMHTSLSGPVRGPKADPAICALRSQLLTPLRLMERQAQPRRSMNLRATAALTLRLQRVHFAVRRLQATIVRSHRYQARLHLTEEHNSLMTLNRIMDGLPPSIPNAPRHRSSGDHQNHSPTTNNKNCSTAG